MRLNWAVTLAVVAALSLASSPASAARKKYGKPAKRAAAGENAAESAAFIDASGSSRVAPNPQKARQTNEKALKLAQSGKLVEALPIFIEAMNLAPGESEFINNVGVTEMRLGRLESAMSRFKLALKNDPNNDAAQANLKDLEDYMQQPGNTPQESQQQHSSVRLGTARGRAV